jgi:cell division protein FtsN
MDLEGFSVQAGSFTDQSKAHGMQSELLNKGYISSVRRSQKENVIYYRVRIPCKSRVDAERIATKLRLEGYSAKVFP